MAVCRLWTRVVDVPFENKVMFASGTYCFLNQVMKKWVLQENFWMRRGLNPGPYTNSLDD